MSDATDTPISTILVTGATGLVGSNACRQAVEAGYRVRGMVRSPAAAGTLEAVGAEVVLGDINDRDSLVRAAKGADGVIHTAAVLGGTWAKWTPEEFFRINHEGSVTVLDVAREAGLRTVLLSSYGILRWDETMTEDSRTWPIGSQASPYIKAKTATFYEGLARAAADSQHVSFVFPGCIYGPSLFGERALDPTSFTGALLRGLTGELKVYVKMPIAWSFSEDVATVALRSLVKGRNGQSYLALGRGDDVMSLSAFCNLGASIAGIDHRVEEEDPLSNPAKYGTMGQHALRRVAKPMCDGSLTNEELGVQPTPVTEGLTITIDWLRGLGKLP